MGVTGLWTVLQPCARPIKLETLNKKRLAVDASIWIYQFLKAVRDKEGNALRNSHVVGFFRRICKLLFFGIKPVFVFDGGAPALKRQTITARKRRREGRRDDATRTAGKLLAVQMQRRAEEDRERRKRELAESHVRNVEEEDIPDDVVYVEELQMTAQERRQNRTFKKKDQYHLPDLDVSLESMGGPDDPRIMSQEELEEYARQFHSGEDINLYDFSKIDFDSPFFSSLPASDRYNILNAARLRSRLRMGYSKDQLDTMFPDRMAFSRFQIERVRERNDLTQRLMNLHGMNGDDAMFGVNGGGRVAGEKGKEYVLVKNDGVEGGWALGVVSNKDEGGRNQPIDVDVATSAVPADQDGEDSEDDEAFEDVPIEGLNRLPKLKPKQDRARQGLEDMSDSLFVEADASNAREAIERQKQTDDLFEETGSQNSADEDYDLNRAIAMSLEEPSNSNNQHMALEPDHVKHPALTIQSKPFAASDSDSDDDDDMDLQAALAESRLTRHRPQKVRPTADAGKATGKGISNMSPFDGPLPFEKLNSFQFQGNAQIMDVPASDAGGFAKDTEDKEVQKPLPLPPWFSGDIQEDLRAQKNLENRQSELVGTEPDYAGEDQNILHAQATKEIIELHSSSGNNTPEIVPVIDMTSPAKEVSYGDVGHSEGPTLPDSTTQQDEVTEDLSVRQSSPHQQNTDEEPFEWEASDLEDNIKQRDSSPATKSDSSSATFEDVQRSTKTPIVAETTGNEVDILDERDDEIFEDVQIFTKNPMTEDATGSEVDILDETVAALPDGVGIDEDGNDFSDPEDQQLMQQLAIEAEEHARFASSLNHKSQLQNQEEYEHELRSLRNQQKKDRRDADEVTQVMVAECQQLLKLFGLPYITAPMEAEAQCAELVRSSLVDGIVTDDSDCFLFGGTRVYKNMFNQAKFVECYLTSDLEKEFDLDRDKLISFAHLLGSDYTEGIPGIGPVTALEILSEFDSDTGLEDFKLWWQGVQMGKPASDDAKSAFRKKFRRNATRIFLPPSFPSEAVTQAYLHPDVDSSRDPFQWGVPDLDSLRAFLMSTIGWTQERTDEVLVPVIRDMNRRAHEGTQSNLTAFFSGSTGAGASALRRRQDPAAVTRAGKRSSQRMEGALGRMQEGAKRKRKSNKGGSAGNKKRRGPEEVSAVTGAPDGTASSDQEHDEEETQSSGSDDQRPDDDSRPRRQQVTRRGRARQGLN
ncbi:MAG: DNA repair protein rad2 [Peltula sp. TS41687]|nr:MAG: DNA repair protein rad2 [Peltula sp. TS41687]